jgi:hypothetical protein
MVFQKQVSINACRFVEDAGRIVPERGKELLVFTAEKTGGNGQ